MDINLPSYPNIGYESSAELIVPKYSGRIDSHFAVDSLDLAQRTTAMREVCDNLHLFYNSGVKFFSKDVLQDLAAQFEAFRNRDRSAPDQKILIPGLNGERVEVEVEMGSIMSRPGDETEWVVGEPLLSYRAYQRLIFLAAPKFPYTALPYFPVTLQYHVRQRRKSTLEFLDYKKPDPVDDVRRHFAESIVEWEKRDTCKLLRLKLRQAATPKIAKIVAFACSTMAYHGARPSCSLHQYTLILTLRDILSTKNGVEKETIECVAQDPMYTDAGKVILLEHGIRVVNDPAAFLEVDDESGVLSFFPNVPVRQIVADIARPAMMLWGKILTLEEAQVKKDTDSIDVFSGS